MNKPSHATSVMSWSTYSQKANPFEIFVVESLTKLNALSGP
jgi:hypothetical protein